MNPSLVPRAGSDPLGSETVLGLLCDLIRIPSINPALGGDVSLSDALDPSNVVIPPNALLNSNGTNADATTSYAGSRPQN